VSTTSTPRWSASSDAALGGCPRQQRGWGDEAAYFADPDGNVFAVASRLAQ